VWKGESQKKKKKNKGLKHRQRGEQRKAERLAAKQVQVRFCQQVIQTNQRIEMPSKAKAVAKGKAKAKAKLLRKPRLRQRLSGDQRERHLRHLLELLGAVLLLASLP
jgi:hypothetical protein